MFPMSRSRRAGPVLAAVLFVVARAAPGDGPGGPAAGGERPGLLVLGGVAAGPASGGGAEVAGAAIAGRVAREKRWGVAVELWPLLGWRIEQGGERRFVPAAAAAVLVGFDGGRRDAAFRLRIEAGAGPMYALDPVPAAGSRWNFFAEAGLRTVPRAGGLSIGYRFVHVSNGTGPGPDNPGLNVHALVLGWSPRGAPAGNIAGR